MIEEPVRPSQEVEQKRFANHLCVNSKVLLAGVDDEGKDEEGQTEEGKTPKGVAIPVKSSQREIEEHECRGVLIV